MSYLLCLRAAKEGLERQNRGRHPHFLAWLRGKIAFLNMVRPELAAKLRVRLDQVAGSS